MDEPTPPPLTPSNTPPAVAPQLPPAPADAARPARRPPRRGRESTVALYLRIPSSVARNLKLAAVAQDRTQSDLVSELLEAHLGTWAAPYRVNGKRAA